MKKIIEIYKKVQDWAKSRETLITRIVLIIVSIGAIALFFISQYIPVKIISFFTIVSAGYHFWKFDCEWLNSLMRKKERFRLNKDKIKNIWIIIKVNKLLMLNYLFFSLLLGVTFFQSLIYIGKFNKLNFIDTIILIFFCTTICYFIILINIKLNEKIETNNNQNKNVFLKRIYFFVLSVIIVIGLSLRLYKLGWWSYWIDEFNSMLTAKQILSGEIIPRWIETRAFIFHTYLSGFLYLTKETAFYARLANFTFTFGIIGTIIFITKKYFNKTTTIIAVLFFTLSPLAINMSRYIRFYEIAAFLFLLLILSFYYFIESFIFYNLNIKKYLTNKKNIFWLACSIILTLIASDSQFLILLIGPSILLYLLVLSIITRKNKYIFLLSTGLVSLFVVCRFFWGTFNPLILFKIPYPSWFSDISLAPYNYYTNLLIIQFGFIIISICTAGLLFLKKERKFDCDRLVLFLFANVVTILLFLSYSRYKLNHYIYILIPILSILLAIGTNLFIKYIYKKPYKIIVIMLFSIISLNLFIQARDATINRENAYTLNFENATSYIQKNYNEGDKIIVSYYAQPVNLYDLKLDYLFVDLDTYIIDHPKDSYYNLLKLPILTKEKLPDTFKNIISKKNKLFFVISPTREVSQETYRIIEKYGTKIKIEDSKILLYIIK